ncbi:nucleotidyltransferase family protein [uncultured Gelidibacter sp.]|uniref:nucleotidyltransferase family protein n=1 Tax=uncultured Gelidibacter sp. TaxID=259318 RepID=UPI002601F5C3|nr:nucleotidyltransferase family protein [uncultured Gelidibacter sp.]
MTTNPIYITIRHIADILNRQDNQHLLRKRFQESAVDWDHGVIIASQYLMLPALYCELKRKDLLSDIPSDLKLYLEEITSINRNRNKSLLKEADEISALFNQAQIDFVFIKGTVMLANLATEDIGARMVGDIDVVVHPDHIQQAYKLLQAHGYTDTIDFNYETKNFRHLPRQLNPNKIGAIELHSEVLIYQYKKLINIMELLKNKQTIRNLNVPSHEDSIKIAIYTTQINDHAHLFGHLNLKTIYDCLILDLYKKQHLLTNLSQRSYSNSFLELSSLYFPELKPINEKRYSKALKYYYKFKLINPKLGRLTYQSIYYFQQISKRLKLFLNNKSYRAHIFKNIIEFKKH